jgi:hypothetical protein
LADVVRDEVLWPPEQFGELADASVAASQLLEQTPSMRFCDELEELEGRDANGPVADHVPIISN